MGKMNYLPNRGIFLFTGVGQGKTHHENEGKDKVGRAENKRKEKLKSGMQGLSELGAKLIFSLKFFFV